MRTDIRARTADRYRALEIVQAFASQPRATCLIHTGDPMVKARARVVHRGHAAERHMSLEKRYARFPGVLIEITELIA